MARQNNIWNNALQIASASNCKKRHVACIIVDGNGTMVSTGYNWHEDGVCDCDTTKTAVHAEIMAINNIPEELRETKLYAYITHKPCERCQSLLDAICDDTRYEDLSPKLEKEQFSDDVNVKVNPKHYSDVDGVPSIRFFESAARSKEGYQDYLHLTAMKYVYRLWNKDEPKVNIGKCKWFLNKLEESINETPNR